ncbi:hypothetical protein HHI36_009346 [Cryptolaemus montrouzieri]|uniref:DUF4729 domain-containing protein n=1 Tax=Cryptolaemus montrouzieri TaxID=559131 RepID=A0ABD2MVG8_9CUCU
MVDSIDHWATICVCSLCGKIPETTPLFHCPFKHQYCSSCFMELKKKCRGEEEDSCFCEVCQAIVPFKETKTNSEFLRKLKSNPGIGRPFRYDSKPLSNSFSQNKAFESEAIQSLTRPVTVENLFGLPKSELNRLFERKNHGDTIEDNVLTLDYSTYQIHGNHQESKKNSPFCYSFSQFSSHKPIICPHYPCNRMIAVSAFANHFRFEHPELKKYSMERNKEILLPFNVAICECGKSLCLGILTVYETNKVDLLRSKSTHSVIRTCRKFCQKVPIDSFWVMVSGSKSRRKANSYILIWLFSNSGGKYHCTIELSSKNDNVSFSCFSSVNDIPENSTVDDVSKKLNCLHIGYGSAAGLLGEGNPINLRITVH